MAARSWTKAQAGFASLKEETGRKAMFLEINLKPVRRAAVEFLSQECYLHPYLYLAYVPLALSHPLTRAHAGLFLLTELLTPALLAGTRARVVSSSSSIAMLIATFRDGRAMKLGTDAFARPAKLSFGASAMYVPFTGFAHAQLLPGHVLLRTFVDGPCGSAAMARWGEYSTVLLIAGGFGASFALYVLQFMTLCISGWDG
ncbi:uncharacterized protein C8Q71DRAFT_863926 [Rhodofomes roseus]|uniref:Uncharacterized protein n=1 Tax=Rhodofomes roseus TaxID=34475 RepID=A0ABQ8JX29_9APHY|nr:uncharacterized protein C8Q71DRAFT_863926 [Rhodofomes roseus]KAH9828541.1 hypothetical protein C8Q71DRAFT_863926 [Rhodofomes roseus]